MQVVCLDLEGVLVPEIWIEFSRRTGIAELSRTTRDEPDYDKLMAFRLRLLDQHGLKLADIQRVIDGMGPMEGARAFLDALRERYQVFILSDTFYEFASPLMRQLGWPSLLCHRLEVDHAGVVTGWRLRMPDQKRAAVNALKALNFQVMAAGDSYNDTAMLGAADAGFFFHPPAAIVEQFPQFPVTDTYDELRAAIDAAAARLAR
ncbi:MAG: bifunctional phosphoserine phosphatase/homoserine phosphotransferase ThrH [Betaproteobacteria bacterium]|nr:bifunctional phosphoserine phosphatase/homoserine phosphotransferase ThrH [Betaproteobacteria bacterium]